MARFVRILVDTETSNEITSGQRIDLDSVISYKVENLTIKIINVAGGILSFVFSDRSVMLKVLNYLDTNLSVNLNPIS
jgi:hypothetical protein